MNTERPYEGQELELFANARNWKAYWASKIRRHLGRKVLDVGAGLGANTTYLLGPEQESWLCLEPDTALCSQIPGMLADHPRKDRVTTRNGTLNDLGPEAQFDTIIYIDVLEHIENDGGELRAALGHLQPGGKIVVLSPAHPGLYTEFDRAIGHFRRYTRQSLRACTPSGAKLVELFALDSFGLMASVANRLLLHQSMPTLKQVELWDRRLVPVSRWTDPIIGYAIGKSLIGIWQKEGRPSSEEIRL